MTVRYIPVHLPELTDPPIFNAAAVAIRLRAMRTAAVLSPAMMMRSTRPSG